MDVVLNWLWQGGIVALAAAAILRLIPHSRTQARYCTVWAACAAVVVLPAMSLLGAAAVPAGEATRSSSASLVALPLRWWTSATTALGLWAIWAVGYAWRLGAAVVALRHAKRHARAFPADLETQLRHWMRMRATGRRAPAP